MGFPRVRNSALYNMVFPLPTLNSCLWLSACNNDCACTSWLTTFTKIFSYCTHHRWYYLCTHQLTRMEARIAGSEQIRVKMLKQPHTDANKIDRITKLCLSTDPYTFIWRFSRVREEVDCAITTALFCNTSQWLVSIEPDLLLIFLSVLWARRVYLALCAIKTGSVRDYLDHAHFMVSVKWAWWHHLARPRLNHFIFVYSCAGCAAIIEAYFAKVSL